MGQAKRKRDLLGMSKQHYREYLEKERVSALIDTLPNKEELVANIHDVSYNKDTQYLVLATDDMRTGKAVIDGIEGFALSISPRVAIAKSPMENYIILLCYKYVFDAAIVFDHALQVAEELTELLRSYPLGNKATEAEFQIWFKRHGDKVSSFPSYIVKRNANGDFERVVFDKGGQKVS